MGDLKFDNAPKIVVKQGAPKPVQFVYPYYDNPNFFRQQLELWASFPADLLPWLKVIVIDDSSPSVAASAVPRPLLPFLLRVFRIEVDVRWNWLAARNIGMHHAEEGWCLLTDMDHMVRPDVLRRVIHGEHDPKIIYKFSRRESDGTAIHPHPNSMLMTRAMFWKVGGYDERLSGFYGTDGDWRRRCAATAGILMLSDQLERHERIGDSSTIRYQRKQPQDAGKKPIVEARKKTPNWRPKTLSFPYHEEMLDA